LGDWVVRASLAMVCMMFIVHTISGFQQSFNMCWPDAYRLPAKINIGMRLKHAVNPKAIQIQRIRHCTSGQANRKYLGD
jgi:hypothetical protein